MKANRTVEGLHPILHEIIDRIESKVIQKHNVPFRLFETSRSPTRHQALLDKGKTRDLVSKHLYDLKKDPPLFAIAVDYVYFKNNFSWNLRDDTVANWYKLFGSLVLDACPELIWSGHKRKAINYCHFELSHAILLENITLHPCTTY